MIGGILVQTAHRIFDLKGRVTVKYVVTANKTIHFIIHEHFFLAH